MAIACTFGALPAAAVTKDWTRATASADGTYAYNKATNWNPSGVPGLADVARFNRGAAYTVTFAGASKVNRIIVGNDNLIMDMRGGSYTTTSTAQTSLLMGVKANDVARLQIKNGTLTTSQTILGSTTNSSGSVIVSAGGIWNGLGSLTLGSLGSGNLTVTGGGKVNATWLKLGTVAGAKGTVLVSGTGSSLNIAGNGTVGSNTSASSPTAGIGTFYIYSGATARFDGFLDIRKGGNTLVNGGTLTASAIQNISGGKLGFTAGVINLQNSDFLVGSLGPLGTSVTLTATQTINVVQNTLLNANAVLIMQNGKLTTSMIENNGEIRFNGLPSILQATAIDNSGLIRGLGQTAADITNRGELRAVGSDKLTFSGSVTSSGQINLQSNGTMNFTQRLTNSGALNVAGTLGVPAGVTNSGHMNFTTGVATVGGDLSNTGNGTVAVSGTSAQFQSAVAHNGAGFSVAPTSTVFFSGAVTGAGDFSGGGLLDFLSTSSYSPGGAGEVASLAMSPAAAADSSVALVHMANTLLFQAGSTLFLDLGPGRTGDQIIDSGNVQLANVQIVIDPAFAPQPGDVYTLLTANNIQYSGPISISGQSPLPYQITQSATNLVVSFVPEPSVVAGVCLASTLILGRRRRHANDD
ncbi:MAG: PEP-CTERM sorting domain-containing protein [Tepidisphaeraceae bacterium]